jgi:hypothetical protein
MSTTWPTFLAALRNDLEDNGNNPRWSDEYLYALTCDAIRDYSTWFPKRIDRDEIVLDEGVYPLPDDYVEAINVECPQDTFLKKRDPTPGKSYSSGKLTQYYISGGNLYLSGDPQDGDSVLLTYYATHPVPTSAEDLGEDQQHNDLNFVFTIPDRDIELVRLYVRAQVYTQMRSKQSRLDRFDPGSGRRDDNPLLPETKDLMLEYRQKIADRISMKVINLYYTGRQ